jgi:hypothetical protein
MEDKMTVYTDDVEYPVEPENSEIVSVDVTVAWSNQAVQDQVVKTVAKTIHDEIADKVQQAVFNRLDDVVNAIILETMEKSVQRTDNWGEPIHIQTTIRELLMQDTATWLGAQVDQYGHASGSRAYSKRQTRAQHLFKEATKESLPKRVKAVIAENIGDIDVMIEDAVKAQLRAKLE